jgi:hypothetical protein
VSAQEAAPAIEEGRPSGACGGRGTAEGDCETVSPLAGPIRSARKGDDFDSRRREEVEERGGRWKLAFEVFGEGRNAERTLGRRRQEEGGFAGAEPDEGRLGLGTRRRIEGGAVLPEQDDAPAIPAERHRDAAAGLGEDGRGERARRRGRIEAPLAHLVAEEREPPQVEAGPVVERRRDLVAGDPVEICERHGEVGPLARGESGGRLAREQPGGEEAAANPLRHLPPSEVVGVDPVDVARPRDRRLPDRVEEDDALLFAPLPREVDEENAPLRGDLPHRLGVGLVSGGSRVRTPSCEPGLRDPHRGRPARSRDVDERGEILAVLGDGDAGPGVGGSSRRGDAERTAARSNCTAARPSSARRSAAAVLPRTARRASEPGRASARSLNPTMTTTSAARRSARASS